MAVFPWADLAQAYAFVGNSLLAPMSKTGAAGLDSGFWRAFPTFGSTEVEAAAEGLARFAEGMLADGGELQAEERCDERSLAVGCEAAEDCEAAEGCAAAEGREGIEARAVRACSVEFARLFIGPPRPAAPPWETMYAGDGQSVGFGRPTAQMRELLRRAGLELRNENHQYEDHMGIELLYLSKLCQRAAEVQLGAATDEGAEGAPEVEGATEVEGAAAGAVFVEIRSFVEEHPAAWVGALCERVEQASPDGYFARLLMLEKALLAVAREASSGRTMPL